MNERNSMADVLKGIGIISIVIGHACWEIPAGNMRIPVGPFVYLYHLAVFFFCSGFLFKKTEKNLGDYIYRKLRSLYVPFLVYSAGYILCRNLFLKAGILEGAAYAEGERLIRMTDVITFNSLGELLSAFWFVPVMFFTMCFFAWIFIISKKLPGFWNTIFWMFCTVSAGLAGLYAVWHHYGLLFQMQIVYLMIPVTAAGYVYRRYEDLCGRAVNGIGLCISFGILCAVLFSGIGIIELSQFLIVNVWLFYPVTLMGIWFCLCLGKALQKNRAVGQVTAYIGRNSFDIMAMHFLAFKIVDYVVCHVSGNMENLPAFPHAFDSLWPVYIAAGIGVPLLIRTIFMRGKYFFKYQTKKNRIS